MKRRGFQSVVLGLALMAVGLPLAGCQNYATPGGAADMSLFANVQDRDPELMALYKREPVSPLPVHMAIVRVQAPGYESHTVSVYGWGKYSAITVRDIEKDEDFERLENLPELAGLGTLNRLFLPADL